MQYYIFCKVLLASRIEVAISFASIKKHAFGIAFGWLNCWYIVAVVIVFDSCIVLVRYAFTTSSIVGLRREV